MWGSRITKKVYVDPDNNFQRVADRVSIVSITGNLILSVFKLISGIVAHSNAMISDAPLLPYNFFTNRQRIAFRTARIITPTSAKIARYILAMPTAPNIRQANLTPRASVIF